MRLLQIIGFGAAMALRLADGHQLSEQQIGMQFSSHDFNEDQIITREQFYESAIKQIHDLQQIEVDEQQMEILVENIMESVFEHDRNDDGLDYQEFTQMILAQPHDHDHQHQHEHDHQHYHDHHDHDHDHDHDHHDHDHDHHDHDHHDHDHHDHDHDHDHDHQDYHGHDHDHDHRGHDHHDHQHQHNHDHYHDPHHEHGHSHDEQYVQDIQYSQDEVNQLDL